MMGAGKTTVGKRLARRMGKRFLDLDHEIEFRTGVSIPTIFEIEGEMTFRQRESRLLAELSRESDLVLATGGGVVLNPANRSCLAATGQVIFLQATPAMLFARTRHDRNRPLLQVADPLARIARLVDQREPLYREVADIIVESGGELNALTDRIEREMSSRCAH
jgi:shikimate kinase